MMPTRIGLIGCGGWGKFILRDLKTLGCHVSVVARSEKSQRFAREGHADIIVDHISKLKDIQGLVIATIASTHTKVIMEAAQIHPHIPIFVEKAMTVSVLEAENLVQQYGDRLFVMHKWKYHLGILALAKIVADQKLGRLLGMQLIRFSTANHHPDVDMIWTCMPHDLSIVIAILGHIPTLQAANATQWGNETMALTSLWGQNPWITIEVSTIHQTKQREVRVKCEHGIAVLRDGYAEQIEIYKRNPQTNQLDDAPEILTFGLEMPLFSELREFVAYVNGGPQPRSNAQEGLDIVRAITQARALASITHSGVLI